MASCGVYETQFVFQNFSNTNAGLEFSPNVTVFSIMNFKVFGKKMSLY